jgi:two-component system chemotaxis response regulator CheB
MALCGRENDDCEAVMIAVKKPMIAPINRTVRVLIVDDSAVVRKLLSRELARDARIEVVGTAPDPYVARDLIVSLRPDVLTLDVEMPRMDGITFLRKLMAFFPMPVIVVSSLTAAGTRTAIEAMDAGAVDVVGKPGSSYSVESLSGVLTEKIVQASRATVKRVAARPPSDATRGQTSTAMAQTTDQIIAIGASTGGVTALTTVLTGLPPSTPGTLVVQHMPAQFTSSFAERLDSLCSMRVKEACDGDLVTMGAVLIAPGGKHLTLKRCGAQYLAEIKDGPEVFHQRPSVDVLFDSVARTAGSNAVGAILTGMGADGAAGLLKMRQAGARTLAQDEATSVVFGMPMEAIKCGAAQHVVPLEEISKKLISMARTTP